MIPVQLDGVRRFAAYQVMRVAQVVHPPARFAWSEGDPLPEGAQWLMCGHPSTDGTEDHFPIIHPAGTGRSCEWGYCWWEIKWVDVVQNGGLKLIQGGGGDYGETPQGA